METSRAAKFVLCQQATIAVASASTRYQQSPLLQGSSMHCNKRGAWYCYQRQNIGQVYRVCKYSIQRSSGIIVSKLVHRGH